MNAILYISLFLLSILTNNTISSNTTYSEVKINYDKTKIVVQNCLNGILNTLHISEQLTRKPKIKLLLIIHGNLNNVVQHKWKLVHEIKTITQARNINVTKEIYEFVDDAIMSLETEKLSNDTEMHEIERNLNNSKASDFFSKLVGKIDKQSIMAEDTYQISVGNKKDDYEGVERRMNDALQTWEPEDSLNETRRVYGGKPVGISQYPFIVSVHVLGKFSCSGSIISSNFVITAASCLQPGRIYRASQRPIEVRFGSDYAMVEGQVMPALEVIFHPRYDPVHLVHNLAMIKLGNLQPVSKMVTIKKIRMGNFPTNLPRDAVAKGVFILGWGDGKNMRTSNDNQHLTSAFLDMQSLKDCTDIYTSQYVTDNNFCAGLVYKGSGACNGDIGGPAIVLGTLVGVVSFGPPACGTVSDPTVFTKIGYYAEWINDVINERTPKSRPPNHLWLSESAIFSQMSPIRNSHEEMLILRQLIHDLDQPGNKISEIIEEDKDLDDEMKIIFQSTTPADASQHSLLNKSVIVIPGLHLSSIATTPPNFKITDPNIIDIGLPEIIPYEHLHGYVTENIQDSAELRYFVQQYMSQGTLFKAKDKDASEKGASNQKSLETHGNFEYESGEGMSIEIPPEGFVNNKNENVNIEVHQKGLRVKSLDEEMAVFDLGDHQDFFNIEGKMQELQTTSPMPQTKQSKDVWLEVKRMRQEKKRDGVTVLSPSDTDNFRNIIARNGHLANRVQSLYLTKIGLT